MKASASLSMLQDILASGVLTDHTQRSGEALLQRLSSPVQLVMMGPESDNKHQLHESLMARPIAGTIISMAPPGDDIDFEHADICLWCTTEFGSAEALTWQDAPDLLKDHSFLLLLATPKTVTTVFSEDRLEALGDIAAEEFHSLFPITLEPQSKGSSEALEALVAEITKLVRSGRAADRDSAEYFVRTHRSLLLEQSDPEYHAPPEDDPPVVPAAKALPEAVEPAHTGAPIELYRNAFEHICTSTSELNPPASAEADDDISHILSVCQETYETVADMFSENTSDDPDFLLLKEDVLRSADKLLLMSLENGVTPAISAVTTLLQTRREMATRMAQ